MLCPECKAELQESAEFCPSCGNTVFNKTAVENLLWKKIAPWGALFIVGMIIIMTLVTSELNDTVNSHLRALRKGDIGSAYQYTSAGFRTNTPLPAYVKFVTTYPILRKHTSFEIDKSSSEGDTGELTGHLLVDGERYSSIEFRLAKDDNKWKIQGINIRSVLIAPVSAYLATLRDKSFEEAYEYTSEEFQTDTALPAFKKFVSAYPVLTSHTAFITDLADRQKDRGRITGYLFWDSKKAAWIEFIMSKQNNDWKIKGIQLKNPESKPNS
jgi:hypothetical protein